MTKTAKAIDNGEIGGFGGAVEREKFFFGKKRPAAKIPLAILAIITFLIAPMPGQHGFDKIAAAGSPISGVQDVTAKANQSQVIWYQNSWWGVFKTTLSGSPWWIYKFNGSSWSANTYTGISVSGSSGADIHIDETNGKLYVLVSTSQRISRLTYNAGAWTVDSGFPKTLSINTSSGDPACLTRAIDGDLFVFYEDGGDLKGVHSTDQGVNWTSAFTIASISGSSLTDAIAFRYNSVNYIGLFVGDGESPHEFSFRRLADNANPTVSSNWTKETLPSGPISNSDDHVSITRDADNNLYMVGKWGNSNKFYLFKRTNGGNWSYYNIEPSYGTRPSVVIDESNNNLIIIGTVGSSSSTARIQYIVMDKNNPHNVGSTGWTSVLENGSNIFNDATVSYQIHDNSSNLMVCASNTSAGQVWYNLVNVDDITLPVFLASFQAIPGDNRINLEWATHSEVDNWEWIVFRRKEGQEDFRELTRLPGNGTTNITTYYNFSDTDVEPETVYAYRLANVDYNGQVNYYPEIVRTSLAPVITFRLYNNYPNPFNAETTVSFEIGERGYTQLEVYDISGRLVKSLFDGRLEPGSYVYKWDGRDERGADAASGVYILNLISGNHRQSLKMVLSR